jgi:uncharacterized protein
MFFRSPVYQSSAMSQFDAPEFITQLFLRLRGDSYRFKLGIGEYQAALQAVESGFGVDEDGLLEMVQILWCSSREQQDKLQRAWESQRQVKAESGKAQRGQKELGGPKETHTDSSSPDIVHFSGHGGLETIAQTTTDSEFASMPVQARIEPEVDENLLELRSYYPVSRRSMTYGWRMLRRIVADGARVVLDVPGTVAAVTGQGYYLGPVYQRRRRNDARLVMLVDQNGSMMPFHRFTRDLVETARQESRLAQENVQVFYFQNVPVMTVYRDMYLMKPIALQEVLDGCDGDTSVLVVSDAGAARGVRRQERIQGTTRFLRKLRRRTSLIAWLNPMAERRWEGSSAEILAYLVPMFQMDRAGFADAVSALRGLVVSGGGV